MFKRKSTPKNYTQNEAVSFLIQIACIMKQHNISVFQMENVQPNWLPSDWKQQYGKLLFSLLTGPIFGLFVGIALIIMTSDSYSFEPMRDILLSILGGMISGLLYGFLVPPKLRIIGGGLVGLATFPFIVLIWSVFDGFSFFYFEEIFYLAFLGGAIGIGIVLIIDVLYDWLIGMSRENPKFGLVGLIISNAFRIWGFSFVGSLIIGLIGGPVGSLIGSFGGLILALITDDSISKDNFGLLGQLSKGDKEIKLTENLRLTKPNFEEFFKLTGGRSPLFLIINGLIMVPFKEVE